MTPLALEITRVKSHSFRMSNERRFDAMFQERIAQKLPSHPLSFRVGHSTATEACRAVCARWLLILKTIRNGMNRANDLLNTAHSYYNAGEALRLGNSGSRENQGTEDRLEGNVP